MEWKSLKDYPPNREGLYLFCFDLTMGISYLRGFYDDYLTITWMEDDIKIIIKNKDIYNITEYLYIPNPKTFIKHIRNKFPNRSISEKKRITVLEKYNYRCAICHDSRMLEIDHIVPFSKGGTNDTYNLQVLCRKCNSIKFDNLHIKDTNGKLFEEIKIRLRYDLYVELVNQSCNLDISINNYINKIIYNFFSNANIKELEFSEKAQEQKST